MCVQGPRIAAREMIILDPGVVEIVSLHKKVWVAVILLKLSDGPCCGQLVAHTHSSMPQESVLQLCWSLLFFLQSLYCMLGVLQMQHVRKSVLPNTWKCRPEH